MNHLLHIKQNKISFIKNLVSQRTDERLKLELSLLKKKDICRQYFRE